MKRGLLYIAFGKRYVEEAIFSAASMKTFSALPATLFTDQPVSSEVFEYVVNIAPGHKRAKVDYISFSPYERTLYIDSDTKINANIEDIFDLLDRFDLAAVQDHCRKGSRWSKVMPEYDEIPYAFPEYNGGVILFGDSARVRTFFNDWRSWFYRYQDKTEGQDQASFRVALWKSDLSIHALPTEYNVRNLAVMKKLAKRSRKADDSTLLKPRIFHWHGLDKPPLFASLKAKFRPMKYY